LREQTGEGWAWTPGFSPDANKGTEETPTLGADRKGGTAGSGTVSHSTDSGLTVSEQEPIDATATVTLDGRPPSDVWADLSSSEAFQQALVNAVLDAGRGRTYLEYHDVLESAGIEALNGSLRSLILGVAQGHEAALWEFLREARQLGSAHSEIDDAVSVARLFTLALEAEPERDTPTIGFTVKPEFREQRADQRETVCRIVAELSRGCDVHLTGSGLTRRWLVDAHRTDLPVSSECITTPTGGPVSELVETALSELNPDGREVRILRELSSEPTETLSYHSLESVFQVSKSRVRQCISRLVDLELVDTFGPSGDRHVELLEAGREYLSEATQQITLSESVSDSGNSNQQERVTPDSGLGGGDARFYQTTYQGRPEKTAAVACGLGSDVCLVNEPVELDETARERKNKRVSYDPETDEAVVSVRAAGALQYVVSVTTALADPDLLNQALTDDRLEAIEEPGLVLREARNIGALSDRALNDPQVLRDALVKWGENLESLTTALNQANAEDKQRIGAEIMRSSHGLSGSIVHLLDAAGIDVTREIRLASGLGFDKLEQVSESVVRSVIIQSKYGVQNTAPYRHFFETEAGKPLLTPPVDANDPVGSLIGSFVIRGKDVHRLQEPLETALSSPGEFLDSTPEFTIPVTVGDADRSVFASTVTRTLKAKNINPTREAVSIVHALTGSPYDAARALNQLGREESLRDVRPGEIRFALSTLEADRILPGHNPTVGKVVHTLLQATEPVSRAELADRAGVSERSIRNNRTELEALGLVSIDARGWRLNISFRTKAERRNPVVPEFVGGEFIDSISALLEAILPPGRYADPNDPLGQVLFWPQNPWGIATGFRVSPWVQLAARLTGTEQPKSETTIQVGPAIRQKPIQEVTA